MLHEELTGKILETSFEVIKELGAGFLESVYEKALVIALRQKGIEAKSQVPLNILFRGQLEYRRLHNQQGWTGLSG